MKANGPTGEEVGVGSEEGHLGTREGGRNGWMCALTQEKTGQGERLRIIAITTRFSFPPSLPPSLLPYLLFLQVIQ